MKQLLLDLDATSPQTLDSFVVGRNAELLQRLREFASGSPAPAAEHFIYVWGEPGSGKTHLLQALNGDGARYLPAGTPARAYRTQPGVRLYLLDDCERLTPSAQVAAFNLYNEVKENGALLLAAGAVAPAGLALREDLRTRLGWGLVYQLHGLSDDEKVAALMQSAQARGMNVSSSVLPYLITHFRRDMRSLSAMLDQLDRYSLETQRPITLPLLRDLLQMETKAE